MKIAITGPAGSGKDAIANILVRDFGFERLRFADPLKMMVRRMYETTGMSRQEVERRVEGDLKEKPCAILGGKTPRHAMQTLGTDWGRKCIDEDLWVRIAIADVEDNAHCDFVNVDCRFDNEARALQKAGFFIIGRRDQTAQMGEAERRHESEAGIDPALVDLYLNRTETLEELRDKVHAVVTALQATEGM